MMWAYVEDLKPGGLTICLDLDEGALFNDGGRDGNVGCDKEKAKHSPDGCGIDTFALRDIEVGEELLCIYADFDVVGGFQAFGL